MCSTDFEAAIWRSTVGRLRRSVGVLGAAGQFGIAVEHDPCENRWSRHGVVPACEAAASPPVYQRPVPARQHELAVLHAQAAARPGADARIAGGSTGPLLGACPTSCRIASQ